MHTKLHVTEFGSGVVGSITRYVNIPELDTFEPVSLALGLMMSQGIQSSLLSASACEQGSVCVCVSGMVLVVEVSESLNPVLLPPGW